jgi:hypothetical protein
LAIQRAELSLAIQVLGGSFIVYITAECQLVPGDLKKNAISSQATITSRGVGVLVNFLELDEKAEGERPQRISKSPHSLNATGPGAPALPGQPLSK